MAYWRKLTLKIPGELLKRLNAYVLENGRMKRMPMSRNAAFMHALRCLLKNETGYEAKPKIRLTPRKPPIDENDPWLGQLRIITETLTEATNAEMLAMLSVEKVTRYDQMRVGVCLSRLGFKRRQVRKDGVSRYVYKRSSALPTEIS